MTPIYIVVALVVLAVIYWLRGPKFAFGTLLVLGSLYVVLVNLITRSMS